MKIVVRNQGDFLAGGKIKKKEKDRGGNGNKEYVLFHKTLTAECNHGFCFAECTDEQWLDNKYPEYGFIVRDKVACGYYCHAFSFNSKNDFRHASERAGTERTFSIASRFFLSRYQT